VPNQAEVILQPYGAFLVDRSLNRFDVVNQVGSALVLRMLAHGGVGVAAWAASRGLDQEAATRLLEGLAARGYRLDPDDGGGAMVSFVDQRDVLKATRAEVEITNRCNLRCDYCYAEVNSSRVERTAAEWIDVLSGMVDHGLRAVLFSGGEPFMHKEFLQVLDWAAPRLVVEINSNGTYITDEVAARLATLDLKLLQISMDSPTPEYHDSVRGRGSHTKAVAAIERLAAAGVPVQVSTVVTSTNRALLPEMLEFAESLGARMKGDPVTRTGFARRISDERWEAEFAATTGDRISSADPTEGALGFEPVCQSQVGYVAVSHHGILKPCNMREQFFEPTGGVLTESVESRWWDGFYGDTGLASLAQSARMIRGAEAEDLQVAASGYLCELQLAVAAEGYGRGTPVALMPTRR
jgi:pyruvate-formate lyase-activating enzyme